MVLRNKNMILCMICDIGFDWLYIINWWFILKEFYWSICM